MDIKEFEYLKKYNIYAKYAIKYNGQCICRTDIKSEGKTEKQAIKEAKVYLDEMLKTKNIIGVRLLPEIKKVDGIYKLRASFFLIDKEN